MTLLRRRQINSSQAEYSRWFRMKFDLYTGNAKRRVSAKRKRQFQGNGSTIKHSKNSSATSANASSSTIKIPAVFDEEIEEYQRKPLTGNRIIDFLF
ncbi:hypothetical protein TNCV_3519351 [Trichonephila clavipes]|uniref:Uncharacterized protein n=1 Tax=Trichonephila clavipes TaxID=2585209 RepID=A0A8X6SUD0_TRICX|nr:hypothetical protein TNCV_3519351 [Trichonephila clavipes]